MFFVGNKDVVGCCNFCRPNVTQVSCLRFGGTKPAGCIVALVSCDCTEFGPFDEEETVISPN